MKLTLAANAHAIALTTADARQVGAFTIPVPDGWTVIDPRSFPDDMLAALPPNVRQTLATTHYDLFAIDMAGPEGFAVLTVLRLPSRLYVTEGSLEPFADRFTTEAARRGIPFEIVGLRTIEVDGVTVGEIEATLNLEPSPIRELIYVAPGASTTALITVGVNARVFEGRRNELAEIANGVEGLVAPSWLERLVAGARGEDGDDRDFAIGFIVGGLVPLAGGSLLLWRLGRARRRRR